MSAKAKLEDEGLRRAAARLLDLLVEEVRAWARREARAAFLAAPGVDGRSDAWLTRLRVDLEGECAALVAELRERLGPTSAWDWAGPGRPPEPGRELRAHPAWDAAASRLERRLERFLVERGLGRGERLRFEPRDLAAAGALLQAAARLFLALAGRSGAGAAAPREERERLERRARRWDGA